MAETTGGTTMGKRTMPIIRPANRGCSIHRPSEKASASAVDTRLVTMPILRLSSAAASQSGFAISSR